MNKEQLKIAKAIAELESVELIPHKGGVLYKNNQGYMCINGVTCDWYNPFDWQILGPLMVKYRVSIVHYDELDCGIDGNGNFDMPCCDICVGKICFMALRNADSDNIPRAILECILKIESKI